MRTIWGIGVIIGFALLLVAVRFLFPTSLWPKFSNVDMFSHGHMSNLQPCAMIAQKTPYGGVAFTMAAVSAVIFGSYLYTIDSLESKTDKWEVAGQVGGVNSKYTMQATDLGITMDLFGFGGVLCNKASFTSQETGSVVSADFTGEDEIHKPPPFSFWLASHLYISLY